MNAPVAAPRKFTVADYYRMAKAGILHEDDRVELLEGTVVEMAPIGSRHAQCVVNLTEAFHRRLAPGQASVRAQQPLRLSDISEPQPDLVLARYRPGLYAAAHPGPADVLLVVEVADTSLDYDRQAKLPLYAAAGIPEYWLVDLTQGRVEVHRQPAGSDYASTRLAGPEDTIAPAAFPETGLLVRDILP